MILVLGLVGLISGASLVFMYRYATPLIASNQEKELESAIFKIMPDGTHYKTVTKGGETIFEVYNKRKNLIGYAVIAEGNGYQGKIKILAGVKKGLFALYGIEILESIETPGLGGEIATSDFKDQFKDLRFVPQIECVKEAKKDMDNKIHAITGATISSKSVTNILNEKLKTITEILR